MDRQKSRVETDKKKRSGSGRSGYQDAIKYANIGMQMCLIIGVGTYLGSFLDGRYSPGRPLYVLAGALLSTCLAIYIIIKEVSRKEE